jgi:hypothetical protein
MVGIWGGPPGLFQAECTEEEKYVPSAYAEDRISNVGNGVNGYHLDWCGGGWIVFVSRQEVE